MIRYPDKIIILDLTGGPYDKEPTTKEVYQGRCRCFLDKEAALRNSQVMNSIYQVVIPDTKMPAVGENMKVGVKQHTSQTDNEWDLVGYVTDFARYDRVCNLNFKLVKENLIEEDIPGYEKESSAT